MKIGVIGTGYWGPNIIRNLLVLNQDLIIYDIERTNLQQTLQRFQECESVNSLEDILKNPTICAIVIAVPLKYHYQLIIKSLQAGKHVYVEKPLCFSADEADKIKNYIKEKVLMVGHITLFSPGIAKIKELISNNSIGKLTNIFLTRTHFGPIYKETDVATEVAAHDIAILLYMIPDEPVTVNAWGTSRLGLNNQDNANIIIGYKDSLLSIINVQWTSVIRERKILVEGTSGTIVYNANQGKEELIIHNQKTAFEALIKGTKPQEAMLMVKSEEIILKETEPLKVELHSFLNCIENNLIPLTNFVFSRKVVLVSEAIRKSMKFNGETVKIPW